MAANKIAVDQARARVTAGQALLVCAYDSDEKFAGNRLAGAISLAEFHRRLTAVSPSAEIIFYCA